MTKPPIFNIHQSNARRAVVRLIIAPTASIMFIIWGEYLLPSDFSLQFSPQDLKGWGGWTFIGLILIGAGIFGLIKELVFALRSLGISGEWHFCLTDDHLTWNVPNHAHGLEIGFHASLSEIKEIEFRTIQGSDDMDKRQYWVHFYDRESIQLQSYSGVSVSWLVSEICEAGVKYNETYR